MDEALRAILAKLDGIEQRLTNLEARQDQSVAAQAEVRATLGVLDRKLDGLTRICSTVAAHSLSPTECDQLGIPRAMTRAAAGSSAPPSIVPMAAKPGE